MTLQKWTLGLAAAGLVTIPYYASAEEKPSPLLTALSSTTISGYVNVSAQWNPGTGNANVPAYAFNFGKQDGFNLDVVKLTLERPLDEAQWSAGYKADLIFGPDANTFFTQSDANPADFGIKQAYVALRAPIGNGLDFKLGVWDTIIGYESFDAGSNPNYTRSYGYTVEPTTHTGLLLTYQLLDSLGLSAGIANTFGPNINARAHPTTAPGVLNGPKAESYKTYMASIAFTAPESMGFLKGSALYAGVINGWNEFAPGGQADQTSVYLGATLATPIEGFKVGAAFDYVGVSGQPATGDESSYVNAWGLYASMQLTEKLSVHARGEYASSDTGFLGPSKVLELTGTLQYDLWKNVLSRLELRWDHAADGSEAYGGSTPGVPTKKNYFTVAANVIYKF